jgi:hypothetical protein
MAWAAGIDLLAALAVKSLPPLAVKSLPPFQFTLLLLSKTLR